MHLSSVDIDILEKSRRLNTGGIDLFWMYWSAPVGAKNEDARMDLIGVSPDDYNPPLKENEFVPIKPLRWVSDIVFSDVLDFIIIGGVGCLHEDSKIYDAELRTYVSIKSLIETHRRPIVLSRTDNGWIKARASVPYYAGHGSMFRVTFASGKSILATREHKVLTRQGYVQVGDLLPGCAVAAPRNLPSMSEHDGACGPRCSEKASDYQCCYSSDYRQCDGQPLLALAAFPDGVPSQDGVPSSSRSTSRSRSGEWEHRCIPDRDRRTTQSSSPHIAHQRVGQYLGGSCATNVAPTRPSPEDQALSVYAHNSSSTWQDVLESPSTGPVPIASFVSESGQIVWTYHTYGYRQQDNRALFQDYSLPHEVFHTHQPMPGYRPVCKRTSASSDSLLYYDRVVSIEYAGEHDYYDLHVPFHNNYVAEGVVNHNSGKTLNMVLAATYYCVMIPNFRYMLTAPKHWQALISFKEFLSFAIDFDNVNGKERRIRKWIKRVSRSPYTLVEFVNGSTMEFKSLDKDATSIMTWSGDMAVVDQAEDDSLDLEEVVGNLGTRLRGQIGGRARLGKLGIMANSAYNPTLWEMFDQYDADPDSIAMILTSYDNPYLTSKQLRHIEKRLGRLGKDAVKRLMMSERPLPKGKEFTEAVISKCQSDSLDNIMDDAIERDLPGYAFENVRGVGITRWMIPPVEGRQYIMVGDPGQGNPPKRNSPPVLVFDVTDFPERPAQLAAFDWVFGNGSYWPFINRMNELYQLYKPVIAAYDSTGTQKSFDDLNVFQGENWEPLNFAGKKKHMVLCLKVLMGKGLIQIPRKLSSIWNQLLMWSEPDKNLRQDIASAMFMVGYILNGFLPMSSGEDTEEIDLERIPDLDRWSSSRMINREVRIRSI